ncbi:hypothetical protein SAY87_028840 [Trapa incisa]|uniref:Uncharacterized protein n=1 Tax=Trapa incisa TaxID=236973 RepID=A0AAN7QQG9_9MYRT|nr:hypothetical protein SAY87_028840 [Trapa incisa]
MSVSCKNELLHQLSWIPLISGLGLIVLLRHIISFTRWVTAAFLSPPKDLRSRYGSWAIVTGCTDGTGRAFALKLAQRGLNLILVSRNRDKLERLSEELLAVNGHLQVRILALDFSGDISDGVREIEEMAKELDVGVLINNVGVTYPVARFFHEVEDELWRSIVRVNVEGTVRVTRAVLPAMFRRGRGAVVSIGSGGAVVAPSHPLSAIYAATKAFVDQLSRSLHVEYRHHGIDIQCQKAVSKISHAVDLNLSLAAVYMSTVPGSNEEPNLYGIVRALVSDADIWRAGIGAGGLPIGGPWNNL